MAGRMTVQQTYSTKTPDCGRQVSPNPHAVSACRLGSPSQRQHPRLLPASPAPLSLLVVRTTSAKVAPAFAAAPAVSG